MRIVRVSVFAALVTPSSSGTNPRRPAAPRAAAPSAIAEYSGTRDTGQHIHLVTHSRKLKNEAEPPGKYDVRGSGSITDQVDNVVIVWRNKPKEEAISANKATLEVADGPDCVLIVEKQRHFEWEGRIGLWYDRAAMTYLQHPDDRPQALDVSGALCSDDLVEF